MSTETEPQERRSLGEIAAERFGGDFHGEGSEQPLESGRGALTIDSAYEQLQETKDRPAAPEAQPEPQKQELPATDDTDNDAIWTTEDLDTITTFQQECVRLEKDLHIFNQAKQINLNELEKTDRSRATMIRIQISEAEKELRQRYDTLAQSAQAIQNKAQEKNTRKTVQYLKQEQEKLDKALPNLDKKQLFNYLKGQGFNKEAIAAESDHRLVVMAEKARRYDEINETKKPAKVKVSIKGKAPAQPDPEYQSALERTNRFGLSRNDASILRRGPGVKKTAPTVKQLESKLKQSGRVDDAVALLQAKRRAMS